MEKKLPKGWVLIQISELAFTSSGGTPKTTIKEYWDGNIPWINSGMLKDNIINEYSRLITERGLKESSAKLFPKNTVVIALTGATTGRIGMLGIETSTNQSVTGIFPNQWYNSKYLFYYLISNRNKILENAIGTAQPHINKAIVDKTKVPLPPLAEQERIAAKLDILFAQHEAMKKALERIPKLLKDFRQQVLTQAVTGKLTEKWREGQGLGEWKKVVLDDLIIKIEAGKSFNCPNYPVSGNNVGLVKISAVTWGEFDENETKTVYDANKIDSSLFIKKNDFLISRANTLELVGNPVIVKNIRHKIMLSDKVWRIKFKLEITKLFTKYFLQSRNGRIAIESRSSGNQLSMRNISQSSFKSIPLNLPPEQEQHKVVSLVESLFEKADMIETHYKKLKQKIDSLPQAILHKALKGELVEQLPTDGDARDLLEEIKKLKIKK